TGWERSTTATPITCRPEPRSRARRQRQKRKQREKRSNARQKCYPVPGVSRFDFVVRAEVLGEREVRGSTEPPASSGRLCSALSRSALQPLPLRRLWLSPTRSPEGAASGPAFSSRGTKAASHPAELGGSSVPRPPEAGCRSASCPC